jgi:hypothetical protein
MKLTDFIDDFAKALKEQIAEDEKRWGDTWRHRTIEGQVDRMMARFVDYQDQHNKGGVPMPWLKVAGEALIGWARDNNSDYYLGDPLLEIVGMFEGEPE